jgi:hypothetical protein
MITVSSPAGYQVMCTDRSSTRGAGTSSHAPVSSPTPVTGPGYPVSAGPRPGGSAPTSRERDHPAPSNVPSRDRVVSGLSRTEPGIAVSRNRSGRSAGNGAPKSSAMARHPSAGPERAHSPGKTTLRTASTRTAPVSPPYSERSSWSPARPGRVAGPAPAAIRAGPHRPDQQQRHVGALPADSSPRDGVEHRPRRPRRGRLPGRPGCGAAAEDAPTDHPAPTGPPGRRDGGRSRRAWWWSGREGDGWCG